jgi:hypothetical protein
MRHDWIRGENSEPLAGQSEAWLDTDMNVLRLWLDNLILVRMVCAIGLDC